MCCNFLFRFGLVLLFMCLTDCNYLDNIVFIGKIELSNKLVESKCVFCESKCSELLTMNFGQSSGGKISLHEPDSDGSNEHMDTADTSGKYATKMRFMHIFQQSLDNADLSFIELCKFLCDCHVWNHICVIETLKKYWHKSRLLLTTFWAWKTETVICKDDIARRLSHRQRNIVGFTSRYGVSHDTMV